MRGRDVSPQFFKNSFTQKTSLLNVSTLFRPGSQSQRTNGGQDQEISAFVGVESVNLKLSKSDFCMPFLV